MANCARLLFWFLLWWLQASPTQGSVAMIGHVGSSDSFTRTALIAAATVTPTYDEEGNLTSDSLWSYTWDGQNRLIQMESGSGVPAAQPRVKLRFTYDAQSRRIRKQVWQETWTAQSSVRIYTLKSDRRFLYDGWNLIAEIDPDGTPARTYLWGTDLSGSSQGAGGVGGLLAINILKGPTAAIGLHYSSYDANGNIIALTNATTGQETAHYTYDAFGQELRASGPAAQANPFHFSTKFTDEETGLVYYGFRYFDASAGKWLTRDPLGERGALNSYQNGFNDLNDNVDILGALDPGTARGFVWATETAQTAGKVVNAGKMLVVTAESAALWVPELLAISASLWFTDEGRAKANEWGLDVAAPWIDFFIDKVPELMPEEELEMEAKAQSSKAADLEVAKFGQLLQEVKDATECRRKKEPQKSCQFRWSPHTIRVDKKTGQQLRWSKYQVAAAGPNELFVTTPGGFTKNFDGGNNAPGNPTTAIEAKYGYVWIGSGSYTSRQKSIYNRVAVQLEIQAAVCKVCNLKFEVAVSNDAALRGFESKLPFTPNPYQLR